MKKPKIEARPAEGFEIMGEHFFVNDRALTPREIKSKYEVMTDTLIDVLNDLLSFGEVTLETETEIKEALIKAGVEL